MGNFCCDEHRSDLDDIRPTKPKGISVKSMVKRESETYSPEKVSNPASPEASKPMPIMAFSLV